VLGIIFDGEDSDDACIPTVEYKSTNLMSIAQLQVSTASGSERIKLNPLILPKLQLGVASISRRRTVSNGFE